MCKCLNMGHVFNLIVIYSGTTVRDRFAIVALSVWVPLENVLNTTCRIARALQSYLRTRRSTKQNLISFVRNLKEFEIVDTPRGDSTWNLDNLKAEDLDTCEAFGFICVGPSKQVQYTIGDYVRAGILRFFEEWESEIDVPLETWARCRPRSSAEYVTPARLRKIIPRFYKRE